MNKNRDVLVNHVVCREDIYPGAGYSMRFGSDSEGEMRDPTIFKQGDQLFDPGTKPTWGNYSMAATDPADGETFWAVQIFAGSKLINGKCNWGTWWAQAKGSNLGQSIFSMETKAVTAGENGGALSLVIHRGGNVSGSASVSYETVATTASADADFQPISGTIEFAPGEESKEVSVPIVNDALLEQNETFDFILSNPSVPATLGDPARTEVTIEDDEIDPVVIVTATDTSASEEGDFGEFLLERVGPTNPELTVNVVVSGTASENEDYVVLPREVRFSSGETIRRLAVIPLDDRAVEGPETVVMTLGAGVGYTVGSPARGEVAIQDGDVIPMVTVEAPVPEAAEPAIAGFYRFTRTGDLSEALSAAYQVSGTAVNGNDYTTLNGRISFPRGRSYCPSDTGTAQ